MPIPLMPTGRRALLLGAIAAPLFLPRPLRAAAPPDSAEGAALVARLRRGGAVLFLRHADTAGEPCDSGFRIGERAGQRNISAAGRAQAVALGRSIAALGIPVERPVLCSPVFRARDTAELAFGPEAVRAEDGLTADDYAGARLGWVLAEHRRLFAAPVPAGRNRVLVGHRGPVEIIMGGIVRGTSLPEAGGLVLEPGGAEGFTLLGILALVPRIGDGNPPCG